MRFLMFSLLLALLGCTKPYSPKVAHVAGASKVEVYRIDGKKDQRPRLAETGETRFDGWSILYKGKDQSPKFAAKLASLLADEQTYTDSYIGCFWPGVGFRAWKDGEALDVLICFKCHNFYFGSPIGETRNNATFCGSPNTTRLVRLAKEAFPDDEEIQALDEKPETLE